MGEDVSDVGTMITETVARIRSLAALISKGRRHVKRFGCTLKESVRNFVCNRAQKIRPADPARPRDPDSRYRCIP
jgi:hypothetical protein